MDFHLILDQKIFKFLGYCLVILTTVLTVGILFFAYMDYDYFKYKLKNRSQPYIYQQSNESVEI